MTYQPSFRFCALWLSFSLVLTAKAFAVFDWDASFDISTGYRKGKLMSTVISFNPASPPANTTPTTPISRDHLTAKKLRIAELALEGEASLCNSWFVKGCATFGRVRDGRYSESTRATASTTEVANKADINRGETRDAVFNLGYLFHPFDYFCASDIFDLGIGPVAGWSWTYQRIKISNTKKFTTTNNPTTNTPMVTVVDNPDLNGLSYVNRWDGPGLGIRALFSTCWLDIDAGYEYYWPRWRAEWNLAIPDVQKGPFSDRRKAHSGFASVAYIDVNYYFLSCWYVGTEVVFQYWKAKHGRETPQAGSFVAVGLPSSQFDRVPEASWKSFDLLIKFGYVF
jgi:hypothetical protein